MTALDELIYQAITADTDLMEAVGNRVRSTCFEVSPDEQDNTPLPCIIVMDDGLQNQPDTKDSEWEGSEDRVTASVEIDATSPRQVKQLIRRVRHAVAAYIGTLADGGEEVPYLENIQSSGIDWDWMKPCYHSTVTYNCIIPNEYEQDEE